MRTEKSGAVIYYKHLKILEDASLNFEQMGRIFYAVLKYDETGVIPKLDRTLLPFFTMIKYDLDACLQKYNRTVEARREAGKMGGRPPKVPNALDEPGISNIQMEAKNNGYIIDKVQAQRFKDRLPEREWLQSPYSFLELAAERIKELYSNKSEQEQKRLFISAVLTWDDLREEYLEWKNKKEVQAKEAEKAEMLKMAKSNYPKACSCGNILQERSGQFICKDCALLCELNEKTLEWEWRDWE